MPIIKNPKHERFAQELAKGKTLEEAHGLAGYKANRSTASVLKQNPNISSRVVELLAERERMHSQSTAKAIERVALTKEWVISKLVANALMALGEQPVGINKNDSGEPVEVFEREAPAANRALELLGKELGMFVDRKEVGKPGEFDNLNADERKRVLDAIDAELASRAGATEEAGSARQAGPVSPLH